MAPLLVQSYNNNLAIIIKKKLWTFTSALGQSLDALDGRWLDLFFTICTSYTLLSSSSVSGDGLSGLHLNFEPKHEDDVSDDAIFLFMQDNRLSFFASFCSKACRICFMYCENIQQWRMEILQEWYYTFFIAFSTFLAAAFLAIRLNELVYTAGSNSMSSLLTLWNGNSRASNLRRICESWIFKSGIGNKRLSSLSFDVN